MIRLVEQQRQRLYEINTIMYPDVKTWKNKLKYLKNYLLSEHHIGTNKKFKHFTQEQAKKTSRDVME